MNGDHSTNRGNYPLTAGIVYPEIRNAVVSIHRGKFRVEGEYDTDVRVPDVVQRCVGFVGEVVAEESVRIGGDLLATGFFVFGPFESPELAMYRMGYFVTAAHVAKAFSDKPIQIVVNRRGGGVTRITSVLSDNWWIHPTDRSADVVVIPIGMQADADIKGITIEHLITAADFSSGEVGVGDELFITGLFTEAPGESRAMPIVRHGNIAMLPTEQIQTEMGFADVHLIEARSIGGLSGSPVFVRVGSEDAGRPRLDSPRGMKLLGVVQGHWDIRESEINRPSIIHDRQRGVNLGIGIVTPAQKILDIIYSEHAREVTMAIEAATTRNSKKSVPGSDMVKPKDDGITKADFEASLTKVTRKVKTK